MATPSSILAWRILWTEEPGGLQSMGQKESDKTERLNTAQYRLHIVIKQATINDSLLMKRGKGFKIDPF